MARRKAVDVDDEDEHPDIFDLDPAKDTANSEPIQVEHTEHHGWFVPSFGRSSLRCRAF